MRKFAEIFSLLDSDQDGWISARKIDIAALPIDILEGFAPMLIEIEECDIEMNFQMFSLAANKLLSVISISERNQILLSHHRAKWKRVKDEFCWNDFMPKINKRQEE